MSTDSNRPEYVWYASYGSNLSRERFMCYIRGGTPPGSTKNHDGCVNKADPEGDLPIDLRRQMVFSSFLDGSDSHWGKGGLAFLKSDLATNQEVSVIEERGNPKESDKPKLHRPWVSYGRMYLITGEQFEQVVAQENGVHVKETGPVNPPKINWKKFLEEGSVTLDAEGYAEGEYNQMLRIGAHDNAPICTFTNNEKNTLETLPPSDSYAETIIRGIFEAIPNLCPEAATSYLGTAAGKSAEDEYINLLRELVNTVHNETVTSDLPVRLQVTATSVRSKNKNEFIVQLERGERRRLKLHAKDRVALSRAADRFAPSIVAVVNVSHEATSKESRKIPRGTLAMDQKLRIAIGSMKGSYVRIEKANTRIKNVPKGRLSGLVDSLLWYQWTRTKARDLLKRIIKSQTEIVRVDHATFGDMEIDCCRIPQEVFDVIGAKSGDFIMIDSAHATHSLRSATLSEKQHGDRQKTQRDALEKHTKQKDTVSYENYHDELQNSYYFQVNAILELEKCAGVENGEDLAPIFIDAEARKLLGIRPGSCVSISRDPFKTLASRMYFVSIPTSLVSIPIIMAVWPGEDQGPLSMLWLIPFMAIVSSVAVIYELRKKL